MAAGVAAHGSMTSLAPLATTGVVTHNPDAALASSTAMGPAAVSFHLVAAAPVHDPITSPAPAVVPVSVRHPPLTLRVPSACASQCCAAELGQPTSSTVDPEIPRHPLG